MPSIELLHTPGCLVCGRANRVGLHLSLHVDPATGAIHTSFTPTQNHIGFEGLLHGGLLATILDEAMVWAAIWSSKKACVAGELNVRFRNPGRVGASLTCTTKLTAARSRLIETTGEITDAAGSPIATATGKYIPLAGDATAAFFKTIVNEPATAEAMRLLKSE